MYKRRRYTRRRKTYRKRYPRRYRRYSRRTRRTRTSYLSCKRQSNTVAFTSISGAGDIRAASAFQLNQVLSFGEYTNLFDQYKINCVVVTFQPDYRLITTTTGSTATQIPVLMPEFHWVIDENDNATPLSIPEMQEYDRYKHRPFNRPIKIKLYPKFSLEVYKQSGNGYASKRGLWLDTISSDTPHYGLKWAIGNFQSGASPPQTVSFKVYVKFYISFRAIK